MIYSGMVFLLNQRYYTYVTKGSLVESHVSMILWYGADESGLHKMM